VRYHHSSGNTHKLLPNKLAIETSLDSSEYSSKKLCMTHVTFCLGKEAAASVVGCVEVVKGAQKRATKVASSVSSGMHIAPRNEKRMKSIHKKDGADLTNIQTRIYKCINEVVYRYIY
jgi:hypothetical protein